MASLPAVSSCHRPARLEGTEKNLLYCSKLKLSWLKYEYYVFISAMFTLLCFHICLFEFNHSDECKTLRGLLLNGCLLASLFVCLQIVNNKLSSLRDWAMKNVTSSLGKIIRLAVRSILRNPLRLSQKQHCTKTLLCS